MREVVLPQAVIEGPSILPSCGATIFNPVLSCIKSARETTWEFIHGSFSYGLALKADCIASAHKGWMRTRDALCTLGESQESLMDCWSSLPHHPSIITLSYR